MKRISRITLLFFVVLAALLAFTYWRLPQTFYQQDEWQVLGYNLVQGPYNIIKYSSPIQLFLGEGRPLTRALNIIFFGVFQYTIMPTVLFALVLHFLNCWLVFRLAEKLSSKKIIAVVATLFFAVNGVAFQAVTWAAALGTVPATTFFLFSLFSYLDFLDTQKKKFAHISFLFLFISLLFKEIGIFLFVFYPILYLLRRKKIKVDEAIKAHALFFVYGAAAVIFRLSELFMKTDKKVGAFIGGGGSFYQKVLMDAVLYPLTGVFQTFVPPLIMYDIARSFTLIEYPFVVATGHLDTIYQTLVTDALCAGGTFLLLLILIWVNQREKGKSSFFVWFSFLLSLLSFLPYAVLERGGSYMDSRYYYIAAIGGGFLLGYVVDYLMRWKKLLAPLVIIFIGVLLFRHIQYIETDLSQQVEIAQLRLSLLNSIKQIHPTLGDKNVFYVTGDKEYYGPHNMVPFQQGMGYTLMVWYYHTGKIPASFVEGNVLWDITTQGYKEVNGQGFGYFSDLPSLQSAYHTYHFSKTDVVSFYLDSKKQQLINTTEGTRKLLQ